MKDRVLESDMLHAGVWTTFDHVLYWICVSARLTAIGAWAFGASRADPRFAPVALAMAAFYAFDLFRRIDRERFGR